MDVAITGSSGLVGTALTTSLRQAGHTVRPVVRRDGGGPGSVRWDPEAGTIDTAALAGVDAVVHLAGEGVAAKRWSDQQKARILDSRVRGTTVLAEALAGLDPAPQALLSGSAIGIYGDRGDDEVTEVSPPGSDFLSEVATAWEAGTAPAEAAGIRTVHLRTGIVLDGTGGALAKQLPLFRLGLGGRIGNGKQWFSWISLADEVGAIVHLLTSSVTGAVNLTAPEPVTNGELTATLARVLQRPAVVPVPRFGPTLLLGKELAQALLYTSAKVLPTVLQGDGYRFVHPTLEEALRAILDRPAAA